MKSTRYCIHALKKCLLLWCKCSSAPFSILDLNISSTWLKVLECPCLHDNDNVTKTPLFADSRNWPSCQVGGIQLRETFFKLSTNGLAPSLHIHAAQVATAKARKHCATQILQVSQWSIIHRSLNGEEVTGLNSSRWNPLFFLFFFYCRVLITMVWRQVSSSAVVSGLSNYNLLHSILRD